MKSACRTYDIIPAHESSLLNSYNNNILLLLLVLLLDSVQLMKHLLKIGPVHGGGFQKFLPPSPEQAPAGPRRPPYATGGLGMAHRGLGRFHSLAGSGLRDHCGCIFGDLPGHSLATLTTGSLCSLE